MPGKRKKTFEERVIPNEERCRIRKSRKAQESGALHPPDPKSALKERGILACGLARRLWIYTQFCALQERGNR